MMKKILYSAICLFIACTQGVAQQRPNVIFILADDLGHGDLSCLNPGSKISTPNIDRLAREGKIFSDAHSPASLCTPTRYGLLTGRYAWRTGLKKGVLKHYDPPLIEKERFTVGRLFQDNQYATACIGKWHLGWDWPLKNNGFFRDSITDEHITPKDRLRIEQWVDFSKPLQNGPTTRGFDYYFGDDVPNYPPYAFFENDRVLGSPELLKPDSMYGHPGFMVRGWDLEAVVPTITNKAVEYILAKGRSRKPFFLFFALTSPHVPIAPSARFKGSSKAGPYGDFVQETDDAVAQVIKAVAAAGIAQNTIIIFTSDNCSPGQDGKGMSGAMNAVMNYGHFPNHPFRGMKTDLWEGGHHVPFIVRWPGKVKAGSTSDATICHTDFMATCAEILSSPIPEKEGQDSYSLMPLLLDMKDRRFDRPHTIHHSSEGIFAIRQKDWKLIMTGNSGGGLVPSAPDTINGTPVNRQLYDMRKDPTERNNLYLKFPEKAKALEALLQRSK